MKARIKKTGEIVNLAPYAKITLDQCDSWGNPIELSPEEIELIDKEKVGVKMLDIGDTAVRIDDIILVEKHEVKSPLDGKPIFHIRIYQKSIDRIQQIQCDSREKMKAGYDFIVKACNFT